MKKLTTTQERDRMLEALNTIAAGRLANGERLCKIDMVNEARLALLAIGRHWPRMLGRQTILDARKAAEGGNDA